MGNNSYYNDFLQSAGSLLTERADPADAILSGKALQCREDELYNVEPSYNVESYNVESMNEADMRQAWQYTLDEFIDIARGQFVKHRGKRIIQGILIGPSIEPLPRGSQRGGKLTRPVDDIIREVHRNAIESHVEAWKRGQFPNALPYQKDIPLPPDDVLKDYPDLIRDIESFKSKLGESLDEITLDDLGPHLRPVDKDPEYKPPERVILRKDEARRQPNLYAKGKEIFTQAIDMGTPVYFIIRSGDLYRTGDGAWSRNIEDAWGFRKRVEAEGAIKWGKREGKEPEWRRAEVEQIGEFYDPFKESVAVTEQNRTYMVRVKLNQATVPMLQRWLERMQSQFDLELYGVEQGTGTTEAVITMSADSETSIEMLNNQLKAMRFGEITDTKTESIVTPLTAFITYHTPLNVNDCDSFVEFVHKSGFGEHEQMGRYFLLYDEWPGRVGIGPAIVPYIGESMNEQKIKVSTSRMGEWTREQSEDAIYNMMARAAQGISDELGRDVYIEADTHKLEKDFEDDFETVEGDQFFSGFSATIHDRNTEDEIGTCTVSATWETVDYSSAYGASATLERLEVRITGMQSEQTISEVSAIDADYLFSYHAWREGGLEYPEAWEIAPTEHGLPFPEPIAKLFRRDQWREHNGHWKGDATISLTMKDAMMKYLERAGWAVFDQGRKMFSAIRPENIGESVVEFSFRKNTMMGKKFVSIALDESSDLNELRSQVHTAITEGSKVLIKVGHPAMKRVVEEYRHQKGVHITESIKERTKPKKELYYHGTSVKNLQRILSQGLIPDPKARAWSEDPEAGFTMPSRMSYGGIYLTQNLMTAIASIPTSEKRDNQGVIVVTEVQPRSLTADEDDVRFILDGSSIFDHESALIDLYLSYVTNTNTSYVEKQRDKYIDHAVTFINNRLEKAGASPMHPEQEGRVRAIMDDAFFAAMQRRMAHLPSGQRYFDDRQWDYFEGREDFLELPNKAESESMFMQVADQMTRTMRDVYAVKATYYTQTARSLEPINYRGANKIVAIAELVPSETREGRGAVDVVYGRLPGDFKTQWKQRVGDLELVESIEERIGVAESVNEAAKDELLWIRLGRYDDYRNYGQDIAEVAQQVADSAGEEIRLPMLDMTPQDVLNELSWIKGGLYIWPFVEGDEYVSLFWGDKDANMIRDLNRKEQTQFVKELRKALKEYEK